MIRAVPSVPCPRRQPSVRLRLPFSIGFDDASARKRPGAGYLMCQHIGRCSRLILGRQIVWKKGTSNEETWGYANSVLLHASSFGVRDPRDKSLLRRRLPGLKQRRSIRSGRRSKCASAANSGDGECHRPRADWQKAPPQVQSVASLLMLWQALPFNV
jgi:hypothetical protein